MTWGQQNSQIEAHQQLDYALEREINFFDTAEMYPIPPRAETCFETEKIIGKWNKLKTSRDKIILASKVIGPTSFMKYIRNGSVRLNKENIITALEGSLKRLNTDYIDLYQIHWPARNTNFFGQRGFTPTENENTTPILETLEVLDEIQKSGKVRAFGLSNETPWGTMEFLNLAKKHQYPRIVSVQNPYNLLNRTYEIGMAEVSTREEVGLMAYSPLAFGVLSGKYLDNTAAPTSRLNLFDSYSRYTNTNGIKATKKYVELAKNFNLSPAQMALSFVTSRQFVTSNIIGATNIDQLKMNIDSVEIKLNNELVEEINNIHETIPNPCP